MRLNYGKLISMSSGWALLETYMPYDNGALLWHIADFIEENKDHLDNIEMWQTFQDIFQRLNPGCSLEIDDEYRLFINVPDSIWTMALIGLGDNLVTKFGME